MRLHRLLLMALTLSLMQPLLAGEVAAPTVAKILRLIAANSGQTKIACQDPEVTAELSKLGIGQDHEAKVVWALNDGEVSKAVRASRMVICGQVSQIALGASIAIVAEGGYPVIYIKPSNAAASQVKIPDAVLKIGKVVK